MGFEGLLLCFVFSALFIESVITRPLSLQGQDGIEY